MDRDMDIEDKNKITVRWKDVTVEISTTPEQQERLVKLAMELSLDSITSVFGADAQTYLTEEIEHQRKLLFILHKNRRFLEQQKATLGTHEVSLRLVNELDELYKGIQEISTKIDALSRQLTVQQIRSAGIKNERNRTDSGSSVRQGP